MVVLCAPVSNAQAVLKWAFERRKKVLFFPDQHLGRKYGKKDGNWLIGDGALGSSIAAGREL